MRIGVIGVFISTLISSIVIFFVVSVPIIFQVGFNFSLNKIKEILKYGVPMIASQLGAFIVNISDRFFIKAFFSVAEAGIYSLGYRFGTLPSTFVSEPFIKVWLPRRLEVFKQEESEKVFGKIFTYFVTLMLFAGLIVSILTKDILRIISDSEFWPAYKIVPIIALSIIIFTLHYHFNIGLVISKKTKYFAFINFSNGILILILNFIFIPKYGMYGAAYATLIGYIYKVSLTYYFSSKYLKINLEYDRLSKVIIIIIVIFIIDFNIHLDRLYISLLFKFLLILMFIPLMLIAKFFTDDEIKQASTIIKSKIFSS